MRKWIVAGNWKMHNTIAESIMLAKAIQDGSSDIQGGAVILAPPFTALSAVGEAIKGSCLELAAQNMHYEDKGAFTGEVSPLMLKDIGCRYVIIGHSERREYFAETDETVNKKAKAALAWGVRPIICCGESLAQRESGETFTLIEGQITAAFAGIPVEKTHLITIAYEPIWAIGTGKVATDEQAQEVCAFIRGLVAKIYDEQTAAAIRIQYGGSVNAKNAAGLFAQPDIDGGLVGGASLKAEDFAVICNAGA